MNDFIERFKQCFTDGMSLHEAIEYMNLQGDVAKKLLTQYWRILEQEEAFECAKPYFDRLQTMQ